jgi:hypothetical protein
MKKLLLILLALLPFVSKAQLDTVWVGDDYFDQYIFPPLIDNSIERSNLVNNGGTSGIRTFSFIFDPTTNDFLQAVAQRYEVAENDSVKIIGVALNSYFYYIHNFMHQVDTITLSVLNSDLTETFYEKTFVSGSVADPNFDIVNYMQHPEQHNNFAYPFIECIFDDTITLYEDYYIAFKHNSSCSALINNIGVFGTDLTLMSIYIPDEEWIILPGDGPEINRMVAPYRYSTKYKPYVKTCYYDREWVYIEDLPWYHRYEGLARYEVMANVPTNDSSAFQAFGICPIQAIIDTSSSDSLDSGVVSVELLEENIEIYPNPAKDVLNINSAFAIKEVEIYDALNRLVEKQKSNDKNIQLNLNNLSKGSYIVNIKTAKGSVKKKLIVE